MPAPSRHLPVSRHPEVACSTCHALCCEIYVVHLGGHDLWRLMRGLGLPWDSIAEITHAYPSPASMSFRLDGGPARHCFSLHRRPAGACQFLLELPGGLRRCGVHSFRPWACRSYPLVADASLPAGGALLDHALCPESGGELYREAIPEMLTLLEDDRGEEFLYMRVIARWDQFARHTPPERPIPVEQFVAWLQPLYDQLDRLRTAERGHWQLPAYELVAAYPLPDAVA